MEFLLNFNSWFKLLPASGKLSLFLVIIGAITAGILLQSHYKYSGYQYLYTNLTLTDSNAISERLQAMNVQVQMRGDAILVPGNKVLELRNTLASEGLPRGGGIGFEIFDQKNFGETEFQQRINYIRAVQGELARTISAIDGVEKARVHIVIPEKSLFAEDVKAPSASIAITLHKGRKLADAQVGGIIHMVVTSVEGLNEQHINLIDQNGNVLFKATNDDKGGSNSKALEMQANLESRLQQGVVDMLERIVGTAGVSVKVSSVLNLNAVEKMIESIDPESRVALSENITTETSNGTSGAPGGAPGAATNLPGGTGTTSQGRNENTKRVETNSTFTVSKTTQKILEPVGTIKKLSVAVLIDGTYKTKEDGTKEYQPRTPEEMKKIDDLVRKAVGYSLERGDEVRIENIQFQQPEVDDKAQEAFVQATNSSHWKLFLFDNGKLMGIVLIAGLIFFMLVRLVNSYAPPVNVAYANIIGQEAGRIAEALPAKTNVNIIKRDDPAARDKAEQMAGQIPDLAQRRDGGEINFVETNKSITIEAAITSEEKLRLQAAKMQTEHIIRSDMNEAVQVIRGWMNEG